jgi:hypothetical protein
MNSTKRKVSCTFKRETPLEIQERIYAVAIADVKGRCLRHPPVMPEIQLDTTGSRRAHPHYAFTA